MFNHEDIYEVGGVTVESGDGNDIGDRFQRSRNTRNYCPVPSVLAQPGSPKALCTFKDMDVQAKIKLVLLQFKNCAFKERKTIKTKAATTTTEVKGEIKFAAEIFEVYKLKASFSAGLTNSYSFTATEEEAFGKDGSAFEIGVTVEIETNVDSISLAGTPRSLRGLRKCTEDLSTITKPINNTYLLKSASRNIWISCDEDKKPATPATPAKREDNQIAGESGGADAAPADAGTAPADASTEKGEFTYDDIFGYPEDLDEYCLAFASSGFIPEECE
ncbi:hypothetical protein BGW39_009044 [Mortierella sp. 14UC]|nr:hypothetical protein BGW39_009044 [Mortierella sp. 14UC]